MVPNGLNKRNIQGQIFACNEKTKEKKRQCSKELLSPKVGTAISSPSLSEVSPLLSLYTLVLLCQHLLLEIVD